MFKKKHPKNKFPVLEGQIRAFSNLIDTLPSHIVLASNEGKVLYLNPSAESYFRSLGTDLAGKMLPPGFSDGKTLLWEIPTNQGITRCEFDLFPITFDSQKIYSLVLMGNRHQKNSHRSSDELFFSLFEQSNDGIVICDYDLRIIEWNKAMERISGFSTDEVIGMKLLELLEKVLPDPADWMHISQILQGHLPEMIQHLVGRANFQEIEKEIRDRHGVIRAVQYRMFPVLLDGKLFAGAVIRDITQIKQTEDMLRASEIRFRTLVEAMGEGAIALDLDLNIMFSNPAADSMYGAGPGYLLGRNVRDFIDEKHKHFLQIQPQRIRQGFSNRYELDIADFRGNTRTVHVTSSPWRNVNQEIKGSILVFSDITELKAEAERLRFTSTHDEMTGLFNRNYYEEEKIRLKAGRRYPVSVVIIDMDDFKIVNDTLGHSEGDRLLQEFGTICRQIFRGEDVVARIGGDEFAVILPETDKPAVRSVLERLQEAINRHNVTKPESPISFSAGIGTAKSAGELEDTFRRADNRMYREKKLKKTNNL